MSIACISGHIFSEEVEGTQRNWFEGKDSISRNVRVQALGLVIGDSTSLSCPFVRIRKSCPLWEDGAL